MQVNRCTCRCFMRRWRSSTRPCTANFASSCTATSVTLTVSHTTRDVVCSPYYTSTRQIIYDPMSGQLPQNIVVDPFASVKDKLHDDTQLQRQQKEWEKKQQEKEESATLESSSTSESKSDNTTSNFNNNAVSGTGLDSTNPLPLAGLDKVYGSRASHAMHSMLGPQGWTDAVQSKALPILGRATVEGTRYTVERSTVFENWSHQCAAPVHWHMSKLGSATCKMPHNVNEAAESLQLQIIKGCNVFEIDGAASEIHQNVSTAIREALEAFELSRDGFVMMVRCGVLRQPLFQEEITKVSSMNTAHIRNRILPAFDRLKASSIPSMQLKSGFTISDMTDEQLARLHLRRVSKRSAAGLTPDWMEAFITNVAFNTKLQCIDVVLIEGIHTLFDNRPDEHIDEDIVQLFAYLEQQVKAGFVQYYGISSPYLAPPIIRHYPPLPDDAIVPDIFKTPPVEPQTINLYRLLKLAERACGNSHEHHLRFVEYPFNFTAHQALSTPLPYDTNHTLLTLCRALGLTTLGCTPLETTNLMHQPERYHNFPLESDLKATRLNFLTLCERCTAKEMEVRDSIEKGPKTLPPLHELFAACVYLSAQRQFANLFVFEDWLKHRMMPTFRRAAMQFKEASSSDLKEWCKQYEQMVNDFFRLRHRLFQHKHGAKAARINMVIDYVSPTLAKCPMLNQKAINFATYGCDVVIAGFHVSRYFHEATELNPAKNGQLKIPYEELQALCANPQISYADACPPHPYMLEPPLAQGRFSKQKHKSSADTILIDLRNPKFPDIPEEIDGTPSPMYTSTSDDKQEGAAAGVDSSSRENTDSDNSDRNTISNAQIVNNKVQEMDTQNITNNNNNAEGNTGNSNDTTTNSNNKTDCIHL